MSPLLAECDLLMSFEGSMSSLATLQNVHHYEKYAHQEQGISSQRRAVRFAENDIVMGTTCVHELSKDEKDALWFSREETRAMKMDCVGIIGMLDDGMANMLMVEDDNDLCLRGLEQYSGDSKRHRSIIRRQIYNQVFAIQKVSRSHSVSRTKSAELIAAISREWSRPLCMEAMEFGRADALGAQQLYYGGLGI